VLCVRILSTDEVEYRLSRSVAEQLLNRLELALAQFSAAPVARIARSTFALLVVSKSPAELVAALRGVQDRLSKARITYGGEVALLQSRCGIATVGSAAVHSLDDLVALAQQRC
jgi:hypothetical protein